MKTFISSNDYYDDSIQWLVRKIPVPRILFFLILKTQSPTYCTGKIEWWISVINEFVLVIMSNTGNILSHSIPHVWNNSGKKISCSSYTKRFPPCISQREAIGGFSVFYQNVRNESSTLVSSSLIKQRHWGWGRPLLLSLHRWGDPP